MKLEESHNTVCASMTIQIDVLTLGQLETNCFIVGNAENQQAVIIDPAAEPDVILDQVTKRGYAVQEILLTHTHFDHILASQPIKSALNVPLRLHEDAVPFLRTMRERATRIGIPVRYDPAEPDGFITDGESLAIGGMQFEARLTPGHAPGHLVFVMHEQRVAIVGDCIFRDSIGRTDLPGGDALVLKDSIETHILSLPDDFTLLPGHGPTTTVGRERAENAILAELLRLKA